MGEAAIQEVSFWLNGLPPSPNKGEGWHWSVKNRNDEQWKNDSRRLAQHSRNSQTAGHWPLEFASVKLTFHFATRRRRDLDNLVAASKGIIDGLVGVLIQDDSWTHMALQVEGKLDKRDGVTVTVSG